METSLILNHADHTDRLFQSILRTKTSVLRKGTDQKPSIRAAFPCFVCSQGHNKLNII